MSPLSPKPTNSRKTHRVCFMNFNQHTVVWFAGAKATKTTHISEDSAQDLMFKKGILLITNKVDLTRKLVLIAGSKRLFA